MSTVDVLINFTFFWLDNYSFMDYGKIVSLMQPSASGIVDL